MIDKRMYRETFSQLRASDQAKQEVLQKMQEMKQRKRMPRVLRGAALAAAMMMALAVTARICSIAATSPGSSVRYRLAIRQASMYSTRSASPKASIWDRIVSPTG